MKPIFVVDWRSRLRELFRFVFVLIGYWFFSQAADLFVARGTTAAPFWPAAGFSAACVLAYGNRTLYPIFIAALASNYWSFASYDVGSLQRLAYATVMSAGNTTEAWFGVWLANQIHKKYAATDRVRRRVLMAPPSEGLQEPWLMESLSSVVILTLSISVSSLGCALLGNTTLLLMAPKSFEQDFLYSVLTWWTSDAVAMFIAIPAYVSHMVSTGRDWRRLLEPTQALIFAILMSLLLICFSEALSSILARQVLLCVIAGLWIIICVLGKLNSFVVGNVLILAFAVYGTTHSSGPFLEQKLTDAYLVMQAYLLVITIAGLSMYALNRERSSMSQILSDIREKETRMRYELKLQESSRLLEETNLDLQGVLGTFPDLYFWLTPEGIFLRYYAKDKLLMPPNQFLGKSIRDVMPPDVSAPVMKAIERSVATNETVEVEYYLQINGVSDWFEGRFKRLDNGQVLVVIREITARKATERRLQDLVIQREQDSILLKQRAQELARSNEELEQFAYVASHDLREPLRMVRSFCSIVQEKFAGQLPDKATEYLSFAVSGAKRMQLMVDDLLVLSRAGSGCYQLAATDLKEVVQETLETLRHAIQERSVTIELGHLPVVHADAERLTQVILNLVSNAIKFSDRDNPRVRIECETLETCWRICVIDDGIGIDPKHFDRIFVMFQRLHPESKYRGSGVGLAICKKIIQQHGGEIAVSSSRGQGSTFCFTLPKLSDSVISRQTDHRRADESPNHYTDRRQ
jgi:signal transduction histidine kinase